ncbi:MAG TPA: C39 family peptidase [Candidatus Nitrosotenuis sp.]|nr:C39 family peptidase [Candidatus Nitrosotenuis sp.]
MKIRNWQIAQAAQNAKEKYTNLFAAEAEMGKRAVVVLNEHGNNLRETYGCGYTAQLTSGNTVDDLIQNLQNGYPTNIHIARPVDIFDTNGHLAFFGGFPHTLTVVGYDANTDYWQLLDPINPNTYTEWKTKQLVDNWGRKFLFYPPRFSMTTLIPDTICNPPASPSNSDGNLPQPQ